MTKKPNQLFYEKMYAKGRVWEGPQGWLGRLYNLLKKFELHRVDAAVKLLSPGKKMIDIGCGDGGLILKLKDKDKFESYYGIDLAENVVKRAENNLHKNTNNFSNYYIKSTDLDNKLPFKNQYFDAITCIAVLEHIFDPCFAINEINRILRKDGQFILEVPNLVWLPRRISVILGILPITAEEDGWDGGHLHYFTRAAIKKYLEQSGFKVEYMGCTGIFPKILNLWPSLLGGNIIIKARKVKNVKN